MDNNLNNAVSAIKELVKLFRTERLVYLIMTLISVIVLVSTAIYLIIKSDSNQEVIAVIGLFSSTGGIVYSTGRLLKMWSEAMLLIQKVIEQNGQNGQNGQN